MLFAQCIIDKLINEMDIDVQKKNCDFTSKKSFKLFGTKKSTKKIDEVTIST